MKLINIRYFAALREQAGTPGEEWETAAETAVELYEQLRQKHGFSLTPDQVKVAVNEEYRPLDYVLSAGDEVVFIPPVSGG
jgi:molybdopterin synthase sulfur carrier subunit